MRRRPHHREKDLARRGPRREPKLRILIICEGKKTEPRYLKALQHHFRNPLVHVEINAESGVPLTLVERAIALRDEAIRNAKGQRDDNLLFDEIWCVCDVDEHPNLSQACGQARDEGIHVAISNPCFELWALLHFQDQTKTIHRHEAQRQVRSLLAVKEAKLIPLEKLHAGYEDAVQRARQLRKTAASTRQPGRNPTTNLDELTEKIRMGGQL